MSAFDFITQYWLLMLIVFLAFVLYQLYVQLVKARNMALAALSGIEVQMRKRYDLIPNILTIAKEYMNHEKSLMAEITAQRTEALNKSDSVIPEDVADLFSKDSKLSGMMGKLVVSMEAYPELRAVESMNEAMKAYQDVENDISASRRFYNSAVNELKNSVEIFPSSMVARVISIKALPFYEDPTPEAISSTVDAASILNEK